jgi:inner membrane protein
MDQVIATFVELGAWRWLALAAILFAVEMGTGTAYLIWLSAAAAATAALVALPGETTFAVELAAFGVFSIASTVFGRKFFKPPAIVSDKPEINDPLQRHLGARVVAVGDFSGGEGRVSLGDTQWTAQTLDGSSPKNGVGLKVVRVDGTTLQVAGEA